MNIQGSLAFESINPSEIAHAANLFDTLKQYRIKLKNGSEAVLERAFELHVQSVLEKLDARLPGIEDTRQQKIEVIMAKHGLYDAAFQQVVLLCQSISPALGDAIKDLRSVQASFLTDFQAVLADMHGTVRSAHDHVQTKQEEARGYEEGIRRLEDVIGDLNAENSSLNTQVLDLRQHVRQLLTEAQRFGEVDRKAYPVFDTASVHGSGSAQGSAQSVGESGMGSPRKKAGNSSFSASPRGYSTASPRGRSYMAASWDGDSRSSMGTGNGLTTPSKGPLALVAPANWLKTFREEVQKAMDTARCREISLKEAKDMINAVYESKQTANDKALQGIGGVPMETMEQHLFRTLEKKYGLRDLAVVHAGMLLKALQRYEAEDNDVKVFQRIFRNEVEEDFRLVQRELQKSIRDLTQVQVMGRYPTKDQGTVAQMLEAKMTTGIILEDEWKDMISYLYNEMDAYTVCSLLRKQAILDRDALDGPPITISSPVQLPTALSASGSSHKIRSAAPGGYTVGSPSVYTHSSNAGVPGSTLAVQPNSKRLGYSSRTLSITVADPVKVKNKDKLRLPFTVFLSIVLEYQLAAHEEYLSNFTKLFRHVDSNNDGILCAQEFHAFYVMLRQVSTDSGVLRMLLDGQEVEEKEEDLQTLFGLIRLLDPHETDRITFSSAVSVLNSIQAGKIDASAGASGSMGMGGMVQQK